MVQYMTKYKVFLKFICIFWEVQKNLDLKKKITTLDFDPVLTKESTEIYLLELTPPK